MIFPVIAVALSVSTLASAEPRLVVVISIDQFRADYLTRFSKHYLPAKGPNGVGGFKYLMEQGANFRDARYTHFPTSTGPGHATLLSGCGPAVNGIVGNEWFDTTTLKNVYCVSDPNVKVVGGEGSPMSPANLAVTTVGDELKMATNRKAKVVGIAIKDRASILMSGHAADTVIWFSSGNWVTSTHYAPSEKLPAWVSSLNDRHLPDADLNKVWIPLLSKGSYDSARPAPFVKSVPTDRAFEHSLSDANRSKAYNNWITSPFGQKFVFDTVKQALVEEQLGVDDTADILAINLSSNDYVGHTYGPNSPEVMDISIQSDRMLSDLFNTLDKHVSGGLSNVTIALTADHGVMPVAEEMNTTYRVKIAVRPNPADIRTAVQDALKARYGDRKWVLAFTDSFVYLDRKLAAARKVPIEQLERTAAEAAMTATGVKLALTRSQIMDGRVPNWPWAEAAARSFNAQRSGDVVVIEAPSVYFSLGTGTGHGSPWIYDSHVPMLLAGSGIKSGTYYRTVAINDLAPTLSLLLGVEMPSGCVGNPLFEALGR